MWFQNGSNKVAIELWVMQFWSEIILEISNQTRTVRSFDFEITRMISDQIALHSDQSRSINIINQTLIFYGRNIFSWNCLKINVWLFLCRGNVCNDLSHEIRNCFRVSPLTYRTVFNWVSKVIRQFLRLWLLIFLWFETGWVA